MKINESDAACAAITVISSVALTLLGVSMMIQRVERLRARRHIMGRMGMSAAQADQALAVAQTVARQREKDSQTGDSNG